MDHELFVCFSLLEVYKATTFYDALINWITLINFFMPNKVPVIAKLILFRVIIVGVNPSCC
jgi:hypothetical protein